MKIMLLVLGLSDALVVALWYFRMFRSADNSDAGALASFALVIIVVPVLAAINAAAVVGYAIARHFQ